MASPEPHTASEVLIGGIEQREIRVVPYDGAWPEHYAQHATRIRQSLGAGVLQLEHVGSTSVPGLAAKPIIDLLLVVANSADEASYLPQLEAVGYVLRVREPDFQQHRMLRTPQLDVHLHVFSLGADEIDRMLLFRDRLRADADDRRLYEQTKQELAHRSWSDMNAYARAKSPVIEQIMQRAIDSPRGMPHC